ncbi:flagellar biosynthetic protein FliR [Metabacillus iocasae]|uniref:Flagellar biosynthetic protein FliR n=1 Tax=Priestia iocasae TaxID=2291674 RepID=A0ABS2QQZ7_9BACI|nr:flagellar biosynthetic protein FliR [Metabacillus iocasae]MBM7701880.1 flagellar biosynthetic protein FliR [Metabacillus iocasae]
MEQLLLAYPTFLLTFVRMTSFVLTVPLFSYRTIPATHKIGLAAALSILAVSTFETPNLVLDGSFVLLVLKECMVGLMIGLTAYMIIMAIQVAGGLIDFQMGFAIANVIDPQTGAQSPLLGQYLYVIALLVLLATNGHHLLIEGIYYSYQVVAINELFFPVGSEAFVKQAIKTFATMFLIAVQMSLPIVGSLLLVDVALGIVARTVPQLNIFVVGFPLKILVTFALLIVVMASFIYVMQGIFEEMLEAMRNIIAILGGM